jgi:hypothetical protein
LDGTISLVLSLLALVVSATTAWLTLLRRATVKMTQPTTIYFGPDSNRHSDYPKIYLRALLYSTAARGCILQRMFALLRQGDDARYFDVWVYGDDTLRRGSGLFIPQTGLATNHHFLLPLDSTDYRFLTGSYTLELWCAIVGERHARLLSSFELAVTQEQATELEGRDNGLYFDWSANNKGYRSHTRARDEAATMLQELFR